jgi:hypothetical protein
LFRKPVIAAIDLSDDNYITMESTTVFYDEARRKIEEQPLLSYIRFLPHSREGEEDNCLHDSSLPIGRSCYNL